MKPIRTLLTIVMNVLVAVAIALTVRLVVVFFGTVAIQPWAKTVAAITELLVLPFGIADIKTPYGGYFDVNAALSIIVFLIAEWIASVIRARD